LEFGAPIRIVRGEYASGMQTVRDTVERMLSEIRSARDTRRS